MEQFFLVFGRDKNSAHALNKQAELGNSSSASSAASALLALAQVDARASFCRSFRKYNNVW
ncbi:MAG: hypothetical protein AA908_06700 [Chlorobi bacterium NICIL-2]|nr:MAG: hypothetical protein AA908_06700 [Chlorobi bacterium NICIL-2]